MQAISTLAILILAAFALSVCALGIAAGALRRPLPTEDRLLRDLFASLIEQLGYHERGESVAPVALPSFKGTTLRDALEHSDRRAQALETLVLSLTKPLPEIPIVPASSTKRARPRDRKRRSG